MPGTSAFLVNYRMTFYDKEGDLVTVDIEDRASGNGTAAYLDLQPYGDPVTIQTVNNNRDPFSPILAKTATLRFFSTALRNSDNFSSGTDNRFFVEIYTAAVILFRGFLLMDEIEEALLNPEFGNVVTLVATDNIGTLKEQEIVQAASGARIEDGHYPLLYYIQNALAMTGLSLNLNVVFNIFETTQPDTFSPLVRAYVHSLTFEKELTKKEDSYTVLQKILTGLKCRLYQYNGEWWIVRLHELRGSADTIRFIKFDYAGDELATFSYTSIAQPVVPAPLGVMPAGTVYKVNADAQKTAIRPHKYDRDTYRYEYPREIVPNMDFSRGDYISGTNPKLFNWADWMVGRFNGTASVLPYIKRNYDSNDQEDSRYAVLPTAGSGGAHWMRSGAVPISKFDKFNINIDWKLNNNLTGGTGTVATPVAMIYIVGEDGTFWVFGNYYMNTTNQGHIWHQTSGDLDDDYLRSYSLPTHWQPSEINEEYDWTSVSAELPPAPVGGEVFIYLVGFHHPNFGRQEIHFSNLRLEYNPYINGTYAKYNGQFHQVTQAEAYKANRNEDTPVSDSPKKLFKGALMKFNFITAKFTLTENWEDQFSGEGPARLGKILAYDVWNQYRKQRTVINGTLAGVGENMAYCGLYQRFSFTDYSETKRFICLHYDLSVKRNELRGEFLEVHDTDDDNDYSTDHIFQYVQ